MGVTMRASIGQTRLVFNLNAKFRSDSESFLEIQREALVGSVLRFKRGAVGAVRGGLTDARRRIAFQRSAVYEFPAPAGYVPHSLVIEMAEVKPKSYLVVPEGPRSFWRGRLSYSEALGREYRYLEPDRTEIELGSSASFEPLRARIVPWGDSRKRQPETIYVTFVTNNPSPLGQRYRLVIGKLV